MRVGFVADVHSNVHALRSILGHLGMRRDPFGENARQTCSCGRREMAVDRLYHVGDLVGYAAHPSEVVHEMRELAAGGVLGNHDWAALHDRPVPFNPAAFAGLQHSRGALGDEERKYLGGLPLTHEVDFQGLEVTIAHGSPQDPLWEYVFPEEAGRVLDEFVHADAGGRASRALVLGHTHVPLERYSAGTNGTRSALTKVRFRSALFNPGSVGQPRDGDPRAALLVLDTETGESETHRVPYDVAAAGRAIREAGLPVELAERLLVGR